MITHSLLSRAPVLERGRLYDAPRPRVAPVPAARPRHAALTRPPAAGGASDVGAAAVGGWIDLAGFVTSGVTGGGHTPFDDLAGKLSRLHQCCCSYRIGRDVYIDVAGWHLFVKDVRLAQGGGGGGGLTLAQGLAQQLGVLAQQQGRGFDAGQVAALVQKVPLRLGGGKLTVPLADALPAGCLRELEDITEAYARDF
eukprot:scaffold12.g8228.t1